MKILFLSHFFYPGVGGIEVNSEILADRFFSVGHDIRLVTWTKDPGDRSFAYAVIRNPGTIELLKLHLWADVVFENNPVLKLSWPAFFLGKTSVVALRTWISRDSGKPGWQDRLKMRWLARAKGVIAVSRSIGDAYWGRATVIGNPYRNQLFRKLKGVVPSRDFVFLGRLVSNKGADMAIEALARIVYEDQVCTGNLTIVGDGPERANLERLAADLGIQGRVVFRGGLLGECLVSELNVHRYLLVPSRWREPFGNVALEGMACGCVPIVSDGGGLPDAVGEAGLVFERGNLDSLVHAMRSVLNDPLLTEQLHWNAAAHLKNHLPEVVAQRYLTVLEDAFKGDGL